MKKLTVTICAVLVMICIIYLSQTACLLAFYDTQAAYAYPASGKIQEIESVLQEYFIDELDETALGDAAANALIAATGDRWSYYISAEEYQQYEEESQNAYTGVGIVIQEEGIAEGFLITEVRENASAYEMGVRAGDILTAVEGEDARTLGFTGTRDRVRGAEGTSVTLTFLRGDTPYTVALTRKKVETVVASAELLNGKIGHIVISNFNETAARQTIGCMESLIGQGAQAFIFDVRMNPGGMKEELLQILDYILPEGDLFRSVSSAGAESVDRSDAACLEMPMAVLIDADSYSAAEFFAAALQEYQWAKIIGEQTCGKGNYQYTFLLSDGSAVAVSSGRYFTPSGKSLTDVGITPDICVTLDEEQKKKLYYAELPPQEDPQLSAAIAVLSEELR